MSTCFPQTQKAKSFRQPWTEIRQSSEIQKKIFPEIDAVSKFADLVDKTFDVWAANTMDEVYRYQYAKRNMNADGSISDDDWNEIYSTIHGAWARYHCIKCSIYRKISIDK